AHLRADQPAQHRAVPRQPDVRPHGDELPPAPGQGRAAAPRPGGRADPRPAGRARRRGRSRRGEGSAGEEAAVMFADMSMAEVLRDFTPNHEVGLYTSLLAGFLGYHVITRVPPLLHTPLMSATNAISAISLAGSLVVAGSDYSNVPNGWVCQALGFIAVTCSATNAVGGFLITDRMLRMFRKSGEKRAAAKTSEYAGITVVAVIVAALV